MWIIFLEAAVALGIAVGIVWWTWPKKSDAMKEKEAEDSEAKGKGADRDDKR